MADDRDDDEAPALVELPADDVAARLSVPAPAVRAKHTAPALSSASPPSRQAAACATPLTILTGFLGAGKTTLLGALLGHFGSLGQRVAVINNEASAAEVEPSLLESSSVMSFGTLLTLANGCVCCSLTSDLISALNYLLRPAPAESAAAPFVYVLVECSGLASPGPLLEQLWVDEALEQRVYLDGVLCVVDCAHFVANLAGSERGQMEQQLVFSDRVIVNKVDTVSDDDLQRVLSEVSRINSQCDAITAVRSQVPVDSILNIRAFERSDPRTEYSHAAQQRQSTSSTSAVAVAEPAGTAPPRARPSSSPVPALHDPSLVNAVFRSPRRVCLSSLKAWLSAVLWADVYDDSGESVHHRQVTASTGQRVYRMKAAMRASDGSVWFLQSVQRLFDLFEAVSEDDKRTVQGVKLVVIGRNLEHDSLAAGFQSILTDPTDAVR